MKFIGYVVGRDCKKKTSYFTCAECPKIHILPYKTGRTRHLCYACTKAKNDKEREFLKIKRDNEKRLCLMCDKPFNSSGPENRRCAQCEYRLQHDPTGKHSAKTVLRFSAAGKMFKARPFL